MEPLSRPVPERSSADRARAWIDWFGVGRLVAAAAATAVVCLGGYWLVRTPPPATEATLPQATSTTTPSSGAPDSSTPPGDATRATQPADPAPLVHVAGAVVEPGVYELSPGARVRDALVAAGGPAPDADWDALNLAAPVADGSRIYIPLVGEEVPTALVTGPSATDGEAPPGPVDVNRASVDELDALPGVGPATATAIVTERERNGPFLDAADLERVPGIGPAKLEALRDLVTT